MTFGCYLFKRELKLPLPIHACCIHKKQNYNMMKLFFLCPVFALRLIAGHVHAGVDPAPAGSWDPADSYNRTARKQPPTRDQPAPAQYDPYQGQQYASNEPRSPGQQMSGWDSPPPASGRTRAPIPPRDDFGNQRSTGYRVRTLYSAPASPARAATLQPCTLFTPTKYR